MNPHVFLYTHQAISFCPFFDCLCHSSHRQSFLFFLFVRGFFFYPFARFAHIWAFENSRVCFFQSMVGLCAFNQSYPRNTSSFPNWVTPNEINSTCSFMIIQGCTISLMEPVPFRVPSALYTRIGHGILLVVIPLALTNPSSMQLPVQPLSSNI